MSFCSHLDAVNIGMMISCLFQQRGEQNRLIENTCCSGYGVQAQSLSQTQQLDYVFYINSYREMTLLLKQ